MIRCLCGPHKNFRAFRLHRDSGRCPTNTPKGRAFVHWALNTRKLTPKEEQAEAKKKLRLAELRARKQAEKEASRCA